MSTEHHPADPTALRTTTSRRTFLKGAGIGVATLAVGPLAGAVADPRHALAASGHEASASGTAQTGPYQLQNGFWKLEGEYGKFTSAAVDPTGKGNYQDPDMLQGFYLGTTDVYGPGAGTVTWETGSQSLSLSGIVTAGPAYSIGQGANNGATPQHTTESTFGQTFTVTGAQLTGVSLLLATYASTTSAVTVTLYAGTPGGTLTQVTTERIDPIADNTTYSLNFAAQPAGEFYLEISDFSGTPAWWYHTGSGLASVGGTAYFGNEPQTNLNFVFTATGVQPGPSATWDLSLDGPTLRSSYTLQPESGSVTDQGLTMVTPWQRDGYSVAHDDGILFSRFFSDAGRYMPAQQLKRRANWGTVTLLGDHWVQATGTGPYDLRISSDVSPNLSGPITAAQMMLQLAGRTGSSTSPIHHQVDLEVRPHDDALPAVFPAFTASDAGRAEQLSTFYWERALSWPFNYPQPTGTNGADWMDWMGRMLDWTPTKGSVGEGIALLAISLDADGYVWTWNPPGARAWPFPDPSQYDSRHFATNVMYLLGIWRYYSWSGDEAFLEKIIDRARSALNYCLTTLDGQSGILTIPSSDHTGTFDALGSNYWDITSFGYQDAYINAYFYGALEGMAQLEAHLGQTDRAAQLRQLRTKARQQYNQLFWDDTAGRYIECVDALGDRHDYGSSFVNLEAASFGLPSDEQAARIFEWLDHGSTELTSLVTRITPAGGSTSPTSDQTIGQTFTTTDPIAQVGALFTATGTAVNTPAPLTLSLYSGGPGGRRLGSSTFSWPWPSGYLHVEVPEQPAGTYYLEMSGAKGTVGWVDGSAAGNGQPYLNGSPTTTVTSRNLVAVSPYTTGAADIYSRWIFAPRATTRRNDFWYSYVWQGVTVPWETQLQDGGADLYQSGFDVVARARYRGADDAWGRLTTILDRWAKPDHLCGGAPLYDGEQPQNEVAAGSVGVDIPFPESGLAPTGFLYAFVGLEVEADALAVTPNLPSDLSSAGVQHLVWRGHTVEVLVTADTVEIRGGGLDQRHRYQPGQTVRIPAPKTSA